MPLLFLKTSVSIAPGGLGCRGGTALVFWSCWAFPPACLHCSHRRCQLCKSCRSSCCVVFTLDSLWLVCSVSSCAYFPALGLVFAPVFSPLFFSVVCIIEFLVLFILGVCPLSNMFLRIIYIFSQSSDLMSKDFNFDKV